MTGERTVINSEKEREKGVQSDSSALCDRCGKPLPPHSDVQHCIRCYLTLNSFNTKLEETIRSNESNLKMNGIKCAYCGRPINLGKYCSSACQVAAATYYFFIGLLLLFTCSVFFEMIVLILNNPTGMSTGTSTGMSIEISIWVYTVIPMVIMFILGMIGLYYRFTIPKRIQRERINRSFL